MDGALTVSQQGAGQTTTVEVEKCVFFREAEPEEVKGHQSGRMFDTSNSAGFTAEA